MYRTLYILVLFLLPVFANSQSQLFFSVGAIDNRAADFKVSSMPLSINRMIGCIQFNTGLSLYAGIRGNKTFIRDCPAVVETLPVKFLLFPNPIESYARLTAAGLPSGLDHLRIKVVDALGRSVMDNTITTANLLTGRSIYFGFLSSGNYYLIISAPQIHQVISFIKAN
jgi:hypothetical protein